MELYGSGAMLTQGEGYTPSHEGALLYFAAPEKGLKKAVQVAEEKGIKVLMPFMDIGEHGFIAFLEDSEGNRIGIHSMEA